MVAKVKHAMWKYRFEWMTAYENQKIKVKSVFFYYFSIILSCMFRNIMLINNTYFNNKIELIIINVA